MFWANNGAHGNDPLGLITPYQQKCLTGRTFAGGEFVIAGVKDCGILRPLWSPVGVGRLRSGHPQEVPLLLWSGIL